MKTVFGMLERQRDLPGDWTASRAGWSASLRLSVTLLCVVLLFSISSDRPVVEAKAAASQSKPNIILIYTDDLALREMQKLPRIKEMVAGKGAEFENSFVTYSLCCPARATMLTGRYAHNHGVLQNGGPDGGLSAYWQKGHHKRDLSHQMKRAGYRTTYIGKYLNGYKGRVAPGGWNFWHAYVGNYREPGEKGHKFFERWRNNLVGAKFYDRHDTDVMRDKAVNHIRRAASEDQPLFMTVATNAPHGPALVPERHKGSFDDADVTGVPGYDHYDENKPGWVREDAPLSASEHDVNQRLYKGRLSSMLSVRQLVGSVNAELRRQKELQNTYVIFTSDNGLRLGEHGLRHGKHTAYEPDVRVPLYVRGPGIEQGSTVNEIALDNDLAPTILDMGGASRPDWMDGRSLLPALGGALSERDSFLIESWRNENGYHENIPGYKAVHTRDEVYIRYETGEEEYYDLVEDPHQLQNRIGSVPQETVDRLAAKLEELENCSRAGCREAENSAPGE